MAFVLQKKRASERGKGKKRNRRITAHRLMRVNVQCLSITDLAEMHVYIQPCGVYAIHVASIGTKPGPVPQSWLPKPTNEAKCKKLK